LTEKKVIETLEQRNALLQDKLLEYESDITVIREAILEVLEKLGIDPSKVEDTAQIKRQLARKALPAISGAILGGVGKNPFENLSVLIPIIEKYARERSA